MSEREVVPALAEAIERRRKQLGLSPTAFAKAAGVSLPGLAPLRRGERRNYQERLTAPVTAALRWTPDSIERILAGLPPVELTPEPEDTSDTADALLAMLARIESAIGARDRELGALQDELRELRTELGAVDQRVVRLESRDG